MSTLLSNRGLWDLDDGEDLSAHFEDNRHLLLPELKVDCSVMRHLRTLLVSAASDCEFIANLNAREVHPIHRDATHTLSIDSLLLPDNTLTPVGRQIIIPLISNLPDHQDTPRRSKAIVHAANGHSHRPKTKTASIFSLYDLTASCNLTGQQVTLTLSAHLPIFQYTLHELGPTSPDVPRLAEVSLTIVLSGGEPLTPGEHFGLLLQRAAPGRGAEQSVEPIHLHDTSRGEDVVGVWALGGAHFVRAALAAFAAETETRRNARLDRRRPRARPSRDDWTCRPVLVAHFSPLGERPRFSAGFLRTRAGLREPFVARVSHVYAGLSSAGGRTLSARFESKRAAAMRERSQGWRDADVGFERDEVRQRKGGSRFDVGRGGYDFPSAGAVERNVLGQGSVRLGGAHAVDSHQAGESSSRARDGSLEHSLQSDSGLASMGLMREIEAPTPSSGDATSRRMWSPSVSERGGVGQGDTGDDNRREQTRSGNEVIAGEQSPTLRESTSGWRSDNVDELPRIRMAEVLRYNSSDELDRRSGLGEWTPEAEMDTLNEYCQKYLHASYEEEMKREMEKLYHERRR